MPRLAWRLLHVLALASLAITQPLLGILGDNPTFFTAHDSSPGQIVWLALIVAFVPAAVLAVVEVGAHLLSATWGHRVHIGVMSVLAFLFVIQIVDVVPGPWIVPVLLAAAIAAGLTALYVARQGIRSAVSLLGLAPLLFLVLFLFVSPAASVVFPDDVDAVDLDELLGDDAFLDADTGTDGDPEVEPLTVAERVAQRFPPIYLLVLDEVPMASLLDERGEIDGARWPNFARLAATSHLFSNATTVGFTTERAVPAILTGRAGRAPAPVYSYYPENLFTLLGDIYDVSSADPLVDLCPPSVCDGAAPEAMLELLASAEAAPKGAPDTTGPSATGPTITTAGPAPVDDRDDSSLRLLLDDAMIVFGHLATPDGLDIGLPSIGATWGNFGGDQGTDADDPAQYTDHIPAPTSSTTTTTIEPLPVDVGRVPADDLVEVDPDAVNNENREFLDSLITDDSRVAEFRAELAAITAADTPRLHFLHTLLPHVPWRLHPTGEIYDDAALPGYFNRWDDDPVLALAGQQRHLLQLGFADRLLGEYLDRLEAEGILDAATVIVVADHGISFVPGSRSRGPGVENIGGVAGVPLFYKLPGQSEPMRHAKPVEIVDIVPTIAAQLEIELPWEVHGVDLFGPGIERDRAITDPFTAEVPEPYPPFVEAVTADLLEVFGNGTDGNLYALAGLHERIGESIADLVDAPGTICWVRERPLAVPDADGGTGYVYGRLVTGAADSIPLALTIGDTLTGTSASQQADVAHRVFALGDPLHWVGAEVADIGLHEIVDGRLRPIAEC